jgi:hypothetical protein
MIKPQQLCPACKEIRLQESTGEWVSVCGIILEKQKAGDTKLPHYEIVGYYCERYQECHLWRDEKIKEWKRKVAQKSSLREAEKITL